MMIKPGITDLSKKVDSRYTLVTMAAKRARLIGENPAEAGVIKPVSKAVQEIADGKVQYSRGEDSFESLYGDGSMGIFTPSEPSSDLNLEALRYELEKNALEEKRARERLERELAEQNAENNK